MSLLTGQKPETFLLSQEQQDKLPQAAREALEQVDQLKYFLATAPSNWQPDQIIRRYQLPTGEYISCVLWDNLFHVTGTDIVRSLTYRFLAFGRPVTNNKKFEEGIFSDLRNLKPGTDASLEEPKSEFLDLLYKNNCIRTQKKQKVFYWFSVPHDRLFLDALERDLKREKMGQEPTTRATAEPAMSFYYDSSMTLYDQLTKAVQQSNSSANSLTLGRARTHSISDYQATPLSRTHSRQVSEMMPPPPPQMAQMMSNSGDEFTYMMHDPHQLELEPAASIIPRQMDSSPYVPMPYGQHQYRNPAMSCPPFSLEYSPAPSFTGHVPEEYAQGRAMTYAPETPPQSQPGLYSLNGQMNYGFPTPESSVAGNDFTSHGTQLYDPSLSETAMAMNRTRGVMGVTADQMNVLQGSPTYKQRRRRTSISQQMALSGGPVPSLPNPAHQFGHRPRAASVADGSLRHSLLNQGVQRHTTPLREGPYSRTATPVPSHLANPIFQANEELMKLHMDQDDRFESPMPMDMSRSSVTPGPGDRDSPAKTFTCPVPACGRLFKRLEHLKRHVRTHTQERPYVCSICSKKFSRSDNLAQHRKTHERANGTTVSPSARGGSCDSARGTPVSGDEELDAHQSDEGEHYQQVEFNYQPPSMHFRSFSHDGHLNHYNLPPTSHHSSNFSSMHRATPPNEVEEDVPLPAVTGSSDNSPADTDGSQSYHEESQPAYAHQSYTDMSGNPALGVAPTPEMKDDMTSLLQAESLRKDYMPPPSMMDPALMNQSWGYQ